MFRRRQAAQNADGRKAIFPPAARMRAKTNLIWARRKRRLWFSLPFRRFAPRRFAAVASVHNDNARFLCRFVNLQRSNARFLFHRGSFLCGIACLLFGFASLQRGMGRFLYHGVNLLCGNADLLCRRVNLHCRNVSRQNAGVAAYCGQGCL
jgi:hypothetical protein